MQYRRFIRLFIDFENKSNNFADIKKDLFVENPKYLYIFKYLFGKSTEEYAKILSYTTDEFTKLVNQKKIDDKEAEKFQDSISVYLKVLEEKKVKPSDYLEMVIDNFIKEEKDTIILKLKVDRIVSSKYYSFLLVVFGILVYFGTILSLTQTTPPISLSSRYFAVYLTIFSVFMGIIMLYCRKYRLDTSTRLIYIANIIQNDLNKDNLEMMSFVKKYLQYISDKIIIYTRYPETDSLLEEILDIFMEFDDFINKRVMNQLDKGNFGEIGAFLKSIGLQKTIGRMENYIQIKKHLEEFKLKFEIQPPLKPSKYEISLKYAKILRLNVFNIVSTVTFIFWEIIPYLFIALLITYISYILTNDKNTAGFVFAGVCALFVVVRRRT